MVTSNEQSPRRFEKFSDSTRQALLQAQEETRRLNQGYIDTEHILLGLLKEGSVVELLHALQMSPEKIKTQIEFTVIPGIPGKERAVGEPGLTPGTKEVIQLGVDEARREQSSQITPFHLLIGALRKEAGVAARVLMDQGGRSPLQVLLGKMRNFKPAVKEPDKAGSQKSGAELEAEVNQAFVMKCLKQLEDFFKDPSKSDKDKIRIANIVGGLMRLANKPKPEDPKSTPSA